MNKLKKSQSYLWIVIFAMQMFICMPSKSSNADNQDNNITVEDCISTNLDCTLKPIKLEKQPEELYQDNDLSGLNIAVTAGPTYETIDSVSYIATRSSGKMGYAIAEAAAQRGANVTLISGPVHLDVPQGVFCINVESAEEMQKVAVLEAVNNDIFIGCAAVADYRPEQSINKKIKKKEHNGGLILQLVECIDVIASVAELKINRPFTIGFAAEAKDIAQYAQNKLLDKNLDLICANDISKQSQGFNSDNNALHLFWKTGNKVLPLTSKRILGHQLITEIVVLYKNNQAKKI